MSTFPSIFLWSLVTLYLQIIGTTKFMDAKQICNIYVHWSFIKSRIEMEDLDFIFI